MPLTAPPELEPFEVEYRDQAWKEYSLYELGHFVHLLAKRATHRSDPEKRAKDLRDARNYLRMMEAHLDDLDAESA